jgi:alpha-1,2-mannosyltransferase
MPGERPLRHRSTDSPERAKSGVVKRRVTHAIYGLLAIEIAGVVVFSAAYRSLDHYIYWLGGRAVLSDARLYTDQLADHWYTNTPFMAVLFIPMAQLPLVVARMVWQLASVVVFAWACMTALRLAGHRTSRTTLAAVVAAGLLLGPMWHSLFLGQVNLFLLALVLADVRRVCLGRPAGIWIGIAAAVKLTPAIFVVLLLAAGRVKAAMTACATFVLCGLIGYLIAPDASQLYWLHTFYDTSRVGAPYISNQSPYGAAVRLLGGADHVGAWFQVIPLAIGLVGVAVAALWARRGDWLSAAAVTGTTALLVSPISWVHHWVWVLPALIVLLRHGSRALALCGYLLFLSELPWLTPHHGGPSEYGLHGLMTAVANAYLVGGLTLLVHMTVRLRTTRGRARTRSTPTAFKIAKSSAQSMVELSSGAMSVSGGCRSDPGPEGAGRDRYAS